MLVKYPGMKEAQRLVALPDRPSTVALVDPAQAALLEVRPSIPTLKPPPAGEQKVCEDDPWLGRPLLK